MASIKFSPLTTTATPFRKLSTADTNLNSVKTAPGALQSIVAYNSGTIAFLKLYNKASAPVIASDAALIVATLVIPASGQLSIAFPAGLGFTTGIAYAITGAVGDTDTTAIAASQITLNLSYV